MPGVDELNVQPVVAVPPAVKVTDGGLHETVKPVGGETVEPIVTVPANWNVAAPRLVSVTITLPLPPGAKDTLEELDVIL